MKCFENHYVLIVFPKENLPQIVVQQSPTPTGKVKIGAQSDFSENFGRKK